MPHLFSLVLVLLLLLIFYLLSRVFTGAKDIKTKKNNGRSESSVLFRLFFCLFFSLLLLFYLSSRVFTGVKRDQDRGTYKKEK